MHRILFIILTVTSVDFLQAQTFESDLEHAGSEFLCVAFNPDSRLLASGDNQGRIYLWDSKLQQQVNVFQSDAEKVLKLYFSADGNFLFSAGKGGKIDVWSVRYGLRERTFDAHQGSVTSIALSRDNQYLVTAGTDKKLIVWDFVTGKAIQTLAEPEKEISDIEFSRDGRTFVVAGYDGKVLFYNTSDLSLEKRIAPEGGRIRSVALSPDGKFVAAASDKKGILIYEVYSGYLFKAISSPKDIVYDISFSADGKYLFSGTLNNNVSVAQIHGTRNFSLRSAFYQFISLSASDDGALLAVADASSKIRLFSLKELDIKGRESIHFQNPLAISDDIALELFEPIYPFDSVYNAPTSKLRIKGKVAAKHGVASLTINNKKVVVSASGVFEEEVHIPAGRWVIPFVVIDFNGRKLTRHLITYRDDKNENVRFRNGKDYALLIATDQYDELAQLNNPVFDVTTIKTELEELYHFDTKVLINPTKAQLQEEIRSYGKREYSKTDQLFIFVAGHGVYDDVFKEGYIAARDSRKDDEIKDTYISYANFRNYVNNIPCAHVMVVLDVCYGGTFNPIVAMRSAEGTYGDLDRELFIASKLKYRTRKYITSGGKVYVSDGIKGNHSPFARRFIEGLRNRGGEDGILTYNEIIPFLEKAEPTPTFGGFGNDEPGSDFLFIR